MSDIIKLLKEAELKGRGGAGFPTSDKWQTVLDAKVEQRYIVINGAEGEPGVQKDNFILENYIETVIEGLKIGLETFKNSKGIIYLRSDYYKIFAEKLVELTKGLPVEIFKKSGGYLCGEETVIVEAINGRRKEPTIKPPFPANGGILINNVETWYHIAKIAKGEYKKTRFFTISGEAKNPGVFEMDEKATIETILKETDNYPKFDFFVQSGGGMAGEILLSNELGQSPKGQGAIVIYNKDITDAWELMKTWIDFFYQENCDKCTPCREGVYRIREMLTTKKFDQKVFSDLCFVLEKTSFCALGKVAAVAIKSYYEKVGL